MFDKCPCLSITISTDLFLWFAFSASIVMFCLNVLRFTSDRIKCTWIQMTEKKRKKKSIAILSISNTVFLSFFSPYLLLLGVILIFYILQYLTPLCYLFLFGCIKNRFTDLYIKGYIYIYIYIYILGIIQ